MRIGAISKVFTPRYSFCMRCKTTWFFVKEHSTNYKTGDNCAVGCFPLCEKCWSELTPEQRLPYYKELWLEWANRDKMEWEDIEMAVLAGL